MVDRSSATVGIVDPATSTIGESVPLPPDSPDVLLSGDRAVVVSGGTGELWSLPVSDLATFSATSLPPAAIDGKLMQAQRVVALAKRGNKMSVAVSDPTNTQALDQRPHTSPPVPCPLCIPGSAMCGAPLHDQWAE
jgi:hypothetical protein